MPACCGPPSPSISASSTPPISSAPTPCCARARRSARSCWRASVADLLRRRAGTNPATPPSDHPMDTLTHALSGALTGRLMARQPRAPSGPQPAVWQTVLVGTAAATFPDSDFVLGYISELAYLRGDLHPHPRRPHHPVRHHGVRAVLG